MENTYAFFTGILVILCFLSFRKSKVRPLSAGFGGDLMQATTVGPDPYAGIFDTFAVIYNCIPISLAESRDDRAGVSKGTAHH